MKRKQFPLFLSILVGAALFSCNGHSDSQENGKVDSLEKEIAILKKEARKDALGNVDSIPLVKMDTVKPVILKDREVKPPDKPIKVVKEPVIPPSDGTTIYTFRNGKVSAKVTPWVQNRRKTILFDQQGNQTYQMEDVHLDHSITTRLFFREDGSVKNAPIHNNPGASMYWYETGITFDENNQPMFKTEKQMPEHNLSLNGANRSFWNKNTRQWVAQETVREQPVPQK